MFELKNLCIVVSIFKLQDIIDIIKEIDINPNNLCLEVTESVFMDNFDLINQKLGKLQEMGVSVAIDDFGTGYSSLSYLKDLPIDYLKIDRSFITGIETSEKHIKLIKGVIDLAKSLGIDIIAEGIETEDQLNTVLRCGCNNIQGFYIARPMDEEDALVFIDSFRGLRS